MKYIDISILKEEPIKKVEAKLIIEPLAPLSMVSDLPGSYYKSLLYPTKKMICGLFENILGWHFDNNTRNTIIAELKKTRKKQKIDIDYKVFFQGSTYIPLLMEYFDFVSAPTIDHFKALCTYDDYWSKAYRRADSHLHINGIRYMNADTIADYMAFFEGIDNNADLKSKEKNSEKDNWFKKHIGEFAQYYVSPAKKEFVHLEGQLLFDLLIDDHLYRLLSNCCPQNNVGYMGNNEGWVNILICKQ